MSGLDLGPGSSSPVSRLGPAASALPGNDHTWLVAVVAVIGRTVVWYDALHFTSDSAVRERREIWERIRSSGVLDSL